MDKAKKKAFDAYIAEQKTTGHSAEFINYIKLGLEKKHLRFSKCMCRQYSFKLNDGGWNRCPICGCL